MDKAAPNAISQPEPMNIVVDGGARVKILIKDGPSNHVNDEPKTLWDRVLDSWTFTKVATVAGTIIALVSVISSTLLAAKSYTASLDGLNYSRWSAEKDYQIYCLTLQVHSVRYLNLKLIAHVLRPQTVLSRTLVNT